MRVRSLAYFRAVTLEAFDLEWYVLVDLSGSNRVNGYMEIGFSAVRVQAMRASMRRG